MAELDDIQSSTGREVSHARCCLSYGIKFLVPAARGIRQGHGQLSGGDQGDDVVLHGVEGRFDAQEFTQFLPRARRLAEDEQIRCGILFCGALSGSGNGALIIKGDDKFIAPVFKDGRGQSGLLKLPADRGNTGIAVFSAGEGFGHGCKCGIAEIRACMAELIHGHAAVKCAGAVDLQPVLEEVQLDRRVFGEIAVIPVDQCVQQCLADGVDRIFSPIGPCAGAGIHDGLHLHIPGAEFQCSGQHFLDRALNALVV